MDQDAVKKSRGPRQPPSAWRRLAKLAGLLLGVVGVLYAQNQGVFAGLVSRESPISGAELLRQRAALLAGHRQQAVEPAITQSLPEPAEPSAAAAAAAHSERVQKLEQANEGLHRQLRVLDAKYAQAVGRLEETREECVKTLQDLAIKANETVKMWNKEKKRFIRHITDGAHAELVRRFGAEPARVLLETSHGDMLIEMAPPKLMPMVTLYFLDQVDQGFWDGMSFFRAESHVIQASDVRPDGTRRRDFSVHGACVRLQAHKQALTREAQAFRFRNTRLRSRTTSIPWALPDVREARTFM
jgi:hypothetical protein